MAPERHECPDCETVFLHTSTCPGCGWSSVKAAKAVPKLPEGHAAWIPPAYREPTPEEDAQIRADIARLKASAWWRNTQASSRLPAVNPLVRAEVERLASVGTVLPGILEAAKGARRVLEGPGKG